MKRFEQRNLVLLLFLLFIMLSLIGCNANDSALTENDGNSLPLKIAQADWVDAKQEITLSTGIKMKYVEMGQADGEVVIFLHGMTDNSRSWSLIAPFFTDKYHIYLLDQRGHGDTDKPDLRMYPISLYASDLADFMDQLGIQKANIVGHSMGSMIGQVFAVNYPEKVNTLVLESSAPISADYLGTSLYEIALSFGDNPPDEEFMKDWYYNPNPVDEEFLGYEMAESAAIPPYAWRAITKGFSFSNLMPFMTELKAPTLVLWGSADGFFDKTIQDVLLEAIQGEEFITYDNIGHNIHWEIPEKMAQDVIRFIEAN